LDIATGKLEAAAGALVDRLSPVLPAMQQDQSTAPSKDAATLEAPQGAPCPVALSLDMLLIRIHRVTKQLFALDAKVQV
jgi:hypothetical protein